MIIRESDVMRNKKIVRLALFSVALALGVVGASLMNPSVSEASCYGSYADGHTGVILPCKP